MNLRRGYSLGFVVIFLSITNQAAYSQAVDITFDLNTPVSDLHPRGFPARPDLRAGVGFNLGYFPQGTFADNALGRMGFVVGRKRVSDKANGGVGREGPYTAYRVQGRADLNIWRNGPLNLRGGIALGLDFMTDSAPCNELFCGLPEPVVLVSPSVSAAVRISSKVSGIVEFRGSLYMTDRHTTFPFESGVVLSIGLELAS